MSLDVSQFFVRIDELIRLKSIELDLLVSKTLTTEEAEASLNRFNEYCEEMKEILQRIDIHLAINLIGKP